MDVNSQLSIEIRRILIDRPSADLSLDQAPVRKPSLTRNVPVDNDPLQTNQTGGNLAADLSCPIEGQQQPPTQPILVKLTQNSPLTPTSRLSAPPWPFSGIYS